MSAAELVVAAGESLAAGIAAQVEVWAHVHELSDILIRETTREATS